jgi:RNA-directed DNA polymerase
MTAMITSLTGAPSTSAKWHSIDWKAVQAQVYRLQSRITKAIKLGRWGKVKALQHLLTHSHYAKLLAVKRVTSNTGSRTPGVDGIVWKTAQEKIQAVETLQRRGYIPLPLKRIYIPKKNGKKRPLGIPTMRCRAMQALYLQALEPIAETTADNDSYGFRPYRSCADAIEQCFNVLAKKKSAEWILEGDIKSCFDRISHEWIGKHIPMDKVILRSWLKSGYMEKTIFHPTEEGTPQGSLCKALHKPPYAKQVIMQTNQSLSLIFQ